MKALLRMLFLAAVVLASAVGTASAQYFYLDSNGDGVWTADDRLNATGPTTVDVWINTNANKDGSAAVCQSGETAPIGFFSYTYILEATGGTVTFGTPSNLKADFTVHCTPLASTSTVLIDGYCGTTDQVGLFKVATFQATVASGTPSLAFSSFNTLDPNAFTGFGSASCAGATFGGTILYQTDFMDADGLGAPAGVDQAPQVTAPATQSVNENANLNFTVSAVDPDGPAIASLSASPLPAGATFTPNGTNTSGTFNWTPTFTQAGAYTVTFTAQNVLSGTANTVITVNNVDRAPVVTAPATAGGPENALITFTVSVSDPDGDAITSLGYGPPIAGATFTTGAANTSGTFSWTPTFTQSGSYTATFTANTSGLQGTASTVITVTNVDRAPTVTAPATQTVAENSALSFSVSANDPDGEAIASLTAAPLPAGATFTPNGTNTSGTFSWTPTFTQAGGYTVTFTAANALSGTANTAITVTNTDRAPAVTAPATATGAENTLISFTVSASDPDGDAITSLTAAPLPTGASFTPNGTNTSGTFNWTPSVGQAGSYTVTFTASNALTGTASTTVTVTAGDRAPTVTAPATQSVAENSLLSFTVSASDPDGQAITSLTAAPLPTGATFTPNGTNTSGTFNWTPTFTQAGGYTVTFTATNALSGSANTAITVTNTDRAPTVTAPATASGAENTLLTFTVSASDPDGDAITSLTAAPLPAGASFTPNGTNTSGTFSWTPTFTQAGGYTVTFTAANALSGTANTAITVTNTDRAPTVTAPATQSGSTGALLTFTVSASDPDGDAIASLTAAPLPSGATFTPNGSNTSGTFSWTPLLAQAGDYTVTFTASNALSGTASTAITIVSGDAAPTVTAPATQTVAENSLLSFTVTASDPNGDPISSLTAAPLPAGASFTPSGANTSGTFSWTPTFTQAGSYTVTFTATNALTGTASTVITVTNTDRAPEVTAPATMSGAENSVISFTVSASDPDGDAIASLTAAPLPAGASFTPNGSNTSGTFSWTPSFTQAGSYTVTFTASNALSGTASTVITVDNVDRAPVVTAPASVNGKELALLTFTVSASDPDGDAIASLTAAPLPTGASFAPNGSNTSGTFSWTPGAGQSGSYTVTFTASNALTGTASTTITISTESAPVVTAPPTASGNENTLISFTVSATDPDGDPIASLTAAPLPTGASFTPNGSNTSGTFSWTPTFTQAGGYTVTFTATNSLSGSASTEITVNNVDRAPVVTAPATQTVQELSLLAFTVTASDPDGDAIASLTAAPLPGTATFTPDGSNTSGTFSWTPGNADAGSYTVTFTASNALTGTATTVITVTNINNNPVVTAPTTESASEGVLLTFGVSATDADGDHVTLTAMGLPVGATFADNGDNTGTFSWTPTFTQAGSYTVTFNGSDGNGGTGSASTAITVANVNRCPTANAGGPYTGILNIAISFDGTGSSDPDGDALTYAWNFGDGGTGTGATTTHAYTAIGSYTVTLTVDDGLCQHTATTTATVVDVFQATAFQTGGNSTLRLGSGKSSWCTQIEPLNNSFDISNVILSSIKMINYGMFPAGTVMEIASFGKTATDGDKDHNGVLEITACFAKTDLRNLFSGIPAGTGTYAVRFEGMLVTGGRFRADAMVTVNSKGGALVASISPNPFNPEAVLSFATSQPGAVKVDMFDVQGRLVRTLLDESNAAAGSHDIRISGNGLASGMYLVKIRTVDGETMQKALITK